MYQVDAFPRLRAEDISSTSIFARIRGQWISKPILRKSLLIYASLSPDSGSTWDENST